MTCRREKWKGTSGEHCFVGNCWSHAWTINVAACPLFSASSHVMLHSRFFICISSLNRALFSQIYSYYYIKNCLHIVETRAPPPHTHTLARTHTHQARITKRTFHLPSHCLPASGTVAILTTFIKTMWRVIKFYRNPEPSQNFTRQKHDMKQFTRWGPTNIRCHGGKFSRTGAPGFMHPWLRHCSFLIHFRWRVRQSTSKPVTPPSRPFKCARW